MLKGIVRRAALLEAFADELNDCCGGSSFKAALANSKELVWRLLECDTGIESLIDNKDSHNDGEVDVWFYL